MASAEVDQTTPRFTRSARLRPGQLLTLVGLTGFAVSQPLLSIAGENPTLFTFAGVRGAGVLAFALVVAFVPPLALWATVVVLGLVDRRAGDVAFAGVAALLMAAAVVQWLKAAGLEEAWLLAPMALAAALGFAVLLHRFELVAAWTRYTSPLPVFAVLLLVVASPVSELMRAPSDASPDAAATRAKPPVVFIMLDELPLKSLIRSDGAIDPVRFPNLASLADRSTWYSNYTVMAPGTTESIPSILSGQLPEEGSVLWTSKPDNLFSLLAPTHELTVSETVTQLCGFSNCGMEGAAHGRDRSGVSQLLSQIFDVWRERVSLGPSSGVDLGQFREQAIPLDGETDVQVEVRPSSDLDEGPGLFGQVLARPGRVSDFIDALEPSAVPHLAYLHVMLPHQPWDLYPDGQQFRSPGIVDAVLEDRASDPWTRASIEQTHLFQAQYTDRLVGDVIEKLEETGLFDDALVVVTADHGLNFHALPDVRNIDLDSLDDIAYVPLIVKSPGQVEGQVDDSNLMAIDLLPTIAAEVGVEVGWEVDGYPAGSPGIEARGSTKEMHDFGGVMDRTFQGVVEFDSDDHRPRADERFVGDIGPDDSPIAGLIRRIDAGHHLGRSLAETLREPGPAVRVRDYDDWASAGGGGPVRGHLDGYVEDRDAGDLILVAFDGIVVAAAPVDEDGYFDVLLPPGVVDPAGNDVVILQVGADGALELDPT